MINSIVPGEVLKMAGLPCIAAVVGEYRSLTFGFGAPVPYPSRKHPDRVRGEWRVGSYRSAWRIIRFGRILCGSKDLVEDLELYNLVEGTAFGGFGSLEMISEFGVRLNFNNGLIAEFQCVESDKDEFIHVFGPEHYLARYGWGRGWEIRKSNVPDGYSIVRSSDCVRLVQVLRSLSDQADEAIGLSQVVCAGDDDLLKRFHKALGKIIDIVDYNLLMELPDE